MSQDEGVRLVGAKVSVALCTYNGARFLCEQLDSILAQTLLPYEVIVCDDQSTDSTVDLLRAAALCSQFPIHIHINESRLGPAKNFEKALRLCTGDIIVLSDQDDKWKPEKLAVICKILQRNPRAVYAFTDGDTCDGEGTVLDQSVWQTVGINEAIYGMEGADQLRVLLHHNVIVGASMAFRAPFRDIVLPIPEGWMHDYWIALLGSALFRGIAIPDRLYTYRRHESQVCGLWQKSIVQVIKISLATDETECYDKVKKFQHVIERMYEVRQKALCLAKCLELLKAKEEHLGKRASFRSMRGLSRMFAVIRELFTGRYQKFSDSWYSVLRDL
jgi:glycosyltransferase involved in cell wall biosynthesis